MKKYHNIWKPLLKKEDELPIIEQKGQISLDYFLVESSPEEIEKFEKIIKDTKDKRAVNEMKRET